VLGFCVAGSSVRAHAGTEGADVFTTSSIVKLCFSPQGPWGFTLPNLDGSMPLHSFVLSFQGVESWSPINVNGTGLCPKLNNLGTPCFLCEILRMSQSTCQGYDLLFMLLMVAVPYPLKMFALLSPWLQASGPVSQSASSWTAFSSFVSLRYYEHARLETLH
jgi:hypothetical protein